MTPTWQELKAAIEAVLKEVDGPYLDDAFAKSVAVLRAHLATFDAERDFFEAAMALFESPARCWSESEIEICFVAYHRLVALREGKWPRSKI